MCGLMMAMLKKPSLCNIQRCFVISGAMLFWNVSHSHLRIVQRGPWRRWTNPLWEQDWRLDIAIDESRPPTSSISVWNWPLLSPIGLRDEQDIANKELIVSFHIWFDRTFKRQVWLGHTITIGSRVPIGPFCIYITLIPIKETETTHIKMTYNVKQIFQLNRPLSRIGFPWIWGLVEWGWWDIKLIENFIRLVTFKFVRQGRLFLIETIHWYQIQEKVNFRLYITFLIGYAWGWFHWVSFRCWL